MTRTISILLVAVMLTGIASTVSAGEGRGGAMGFVAGCLFGIRAAGDYNEGKEIHWREWIRLLYLPAIWDGIDGADGITTSELAAEYGAMFY